MLDRRSFLVSAAAGLAVGSAKGDVRKALSDPGPLRMKLGVVSDIHVDVKGGYAHQGWEKALRAFDEWKADGVLLCGDMADFGLDIQLQWVADSWFKVFRGGRRSDGQPVANLLHYGDHDTSGTDYNWCPECVKLFPEEAERVRHIIARNDRKAIWEKCFHEEWAPIVRKTVKGYDFILSHFTRGEPGNPRGNNVPGLEGFLARAKLDPNRPFFYSQHRIPRNTAGGPYVWGQDDGQTTRLFTEKYPNCFCFCGHDHLCSSEEQAIWQGGFTAVQVPSLLYCSSLAGRENSYGENDRPYRKPYFAMDSYPAGLSRHGYFVSIHERAVVIRRWSFFDNGPVGPDWTVPLPFSSGRPYAPAYRAEHEPAPEFPSDAQISFELVDGKDRGKEEHEFLEVRFPLAVATDTTPRANDYEVQLELRRDDVVRIIDQRRVFSSNYGRSLAKDTAPVVCRFPTDAIPREQQVRFVARPLTSFGRAGRAIASPFTTYPFKGVQKRKKA